MHICDRSTHGACNSVANRSCYQLEEGHRGGRAPGGGDYARKGRAKGKGRGGGDPQETPGASC